MWDPELADKIGAIINDLNDELPRHPVEEHFAILKSKLKDLPPAVANNILAAYLAGKKGYEIERDIMTATVQERRLAFICGVVGILLLIAIALFVPNPSTYQYTLFRIVLALAAAGFANYIEGLLNIKWKYLRTAGALAVFVIVYYFSPAALVANPP